MVFCDGPGTATLVVNGRKRTLRGGSCSVRGNELDFDLGVSAIALPTGVVKPDYLGIEVITAQRTSARVVFTIDGDQDVLIDPAVSLAAGRKAGTLRGTGITSRAKVRVDFTCA